MKSGFKFGLLPRIALAIVLGILLGSFMPGGIVKTVVTFTSVFDQFIKFMVPLIIVGLVTPAIAETGRNAGKMLLVTVALAYVSTIIAGFFGYFVASEAFPSLISSTSADAIKEGTAFKSLVSIKIPPILDVMSALVISFILGLGIIFSKAENLKNVMIEIRAIITKTISVALVPLLPFYICGMFLEMTAAGKIKTVLASFATIMIICILLTLVILIFQYTVAGIITRRNPFKALWKMAPAYMTALGTASSAATIPVTRSQAIENGIKPEIADFTIPLCATVHLAGSTVKIVSCAVALILMSGDPSQIQLSSFSIFIALIAIVMVAAPGVPGGAIMAALGILESVLGFSEAQLGLMITLYIAIDSFGTACNVTGDGAIAMIVNKIFSKNEASKE
jgi:Na+/H+-dicarboxylate symporter